MSIGCAGGVWFLEPQLGVTLPGGGLLTSNVFSNVLSSKRVESMFVVPQPVCRTEKLWILPLRSERSRSI